MSDMSKPCRPMARCACMRDSAQEGLFVFVSGVEPSRKSWDSYLQPARSAAPLAATPVRRSRRVGSRARSRGGMELACHRDPGDASRFQCRVLPAMAARMRTNLLALVLAVGVGCSAIAAEPPDIDTLVGRVKTAL